MHRTGRVNNSVFIVCLKQVDDTSDLFLKMWALHDLVPFVQFKKREKYPWRKKAILLHECFSRFLNCTNGTKSRKTSQMIILTIPE